MNTLTGDDRDVNGDIPSEADRGWWAGETREDEWEDNYTWELGPDPADDDGPTDAEWDAMAGEAEALAASERGLRHF